MIWVRKLVVHLLALLLVVSLLVGAVAANIDRNLSQPTRLESWLDESNFYGHFISDVIAQSKQSVNTGGGGAISLNDSAVITAAESAFPPSLVESDVNQIINSNYAWLKGQTTSPNFSINLTGSKQAFGVQVGQYVSTYFESLSVCTPAQLAQFEQVDPLMATCRPASLSPSEEGANISQQIASSSAFLSNPVVTAQSINPKSSSSEPYYQRLSKAPRLYQLAQKLPIYAGAVALILSLAIIFISPRKRKGVRRIAGALLLSGILLVGSSYVLNKLFSHVENKLFNNSTIGQIQQSLTSFMSHAESTLSKTDSIIGAAYLALAVVLYLIVIVSHKRQPKAPKLASDEPEEPVPPQQESQPTLNPASPSVISTSLKPVSRRPVMDVIGTQSPQPKPTTAPVVNKPASSSGPRPRRPRLIQ